MAAADVEAVAANSYSIQSHHYPPLIPLLHHPLITATDHHPAIGINPGDCDGNLVSNSAATAVSHIGGDLPRCCCDRRFGCCSFGLPRCRCKVAVVVVDFFLTF